jgi:drug/metabolite transporter (DMT)-like permease
MAVWFHTVSVSICVLPLLLGWPQAAVLPSWPQAALLAGVSSSSFFSQLLMTRSLQLLPAAQASAISFIQVGHVRGGGAH